MGLVNKDLILSQNPKKRLIIGYDKLKNDYTEESALEYKSLYENQSLSFILENSEKIFSEPYFGYDFYSDIVLNPTVECGAFHEYKNERDKVSTYLESHRSDMDDHQVDMYESLLSSLNEKINNFQNTIMVAEYTMEKHEDNSCVLNLLDYLHEASSPNTSEERAIELEDLMTEVVSQFNDDKRLFIYGPMVAIQCHTRKPVVAFVEAVSSLTPDDITESTDTFGTFVENVTIAHKLCSDPAYETLLYRIPNRDTRSVFYGYEYESVYDLLNDLSTESVDGIETYYTNPKNAVNDIFMGITESAVFNDDNSSIKNRINSLKKAAYEVASDLLLFEYHHCDNPDAKVSGYDIIRSNMTVQEAVIDVGRTIDTLNQRLGIVTETSDDDDYDVNDDDIDRVFNDDNARKSSSKKAEAPTHKSVANTIQYKAMDLEAKQMKHMADTQRKGQGIRGAVKAVTNLPNNVWKSIKQFAHNKDMNDAEKRKKQMAAPGYKNKIFRNLKLALLYGSAAQIKLALVPVTMFFRHFSKERDRRLRNELISELDTEIKICDEKINDAGGAGDNKEKYKLMRIKSALERERLRVRTNSKYI